MDNKILIIILSIFFSSCAQEKKSTLLIEGIPLLTKYSGEPNLIVSDEDDIYLSWIEYKNDSTDVLQFSKLVDCKWSQAKVISEGSNWFVNWADFPSMVIHDSLKMTAHWLQQSAEGAYDYDIRISQSVDGGNTWSKSIIPHRDSVKTEHGFVSMLSTPEGKTFLVWLDGRNLKNETNNAMTLRSAEIDIDGNIANEIELDRRVCDCCQTGATWTEEGPIIVYRDRSKNEVRDIGIIKSIEGKWSTPKILSKDNWKIAGCPVNGPAIISEENFVAVAWFTMSDNEPKVYVMISEDQGENYYEPIRIDDGNAIGRVDIEWLRDGALVSWMSSAGEKADIKIRTVKSNGLLGPVEIVGTNSSSRSSGFPRIVNNKDGLFMAWTDALDSLTQVKTFKIEISYE